MSEFQAPITEIGHALTVAGLARVAALPGCEDASPDLVAAVLEEAGKFAGGVLAPINATGDRTGCRLTEDGSVVTPDGFADAYHQFVEGGWNGLAFDPEHGGQGLPLLLGTAVSEMWQAANMAFALCPMLTAGAVELLSSHAESDQQAQWLPRLISGEWTGTMNLTESQAGSDLAAVKVKARPDPDAGPGCWRITGQKIFITHGVHDMAENIVHLVLARTPDAPPGIKGISLFIVPRFLPDASGAPGEANDVRCVSLEHKMGIHASPTCVMAFGDNGGALGWLVGEENRGIEYMFTMMNNARLGVGIQGVGIAERALQRAQAYAQERIQGVDAADRHSGPVAIIRHGDVRRMLMTMRALTQAARLICYHTAAALDVAKRAPDDGDRLAATARAALMTPIAKAWSTDVGVRVADLGVQVHGGVGFIEETGAAQHLRDSRIAAIYEGTNGIQAIDLVGRKVLRDKGEALGVLVAEIRGDMARAVEQGGVLAPLANRLEAGVADLEAAAAWLLERNDPVSAQAAATPFLALSGLVCGGWLLMDSARQSMADPQQDPSRSEARLATARFFLNHLLPATAGHLAAVQAGADDLMALPDEAFAAE